MLCHKIQVVEQLLTGKRESKSSSAGFLRVVVNAIVGAC